MLSLSNRLTLGLAPRGGGPPAGYAFVTSTNGSGNRVTITTTNNTGNRMPVATRTS